MRKYGLTIDNLLSVDILTAGGELLKASETHNADLFCGVRGGGGNFGIVTELSSGYTHRAGGLRGTDLLANGGCCQGAPLLPRLDHRLPG
jgi:hypothetical protein